jgi:hypothetical protein
MTNVMILQPGARIELVHFSIVRRRDFGGTFDGPGPDPSEKLKPSISVRPFAPDTR